MKVRVLYSLLRRSRNKSMEKMFCPVCQEQDLKSKVFASGGGRTTLMGFTPYYDEEGNYHSHNPNTTTRSYKCSEGHVWEVISINGCPHPMCDYDYEEEIRIIKS